MKGGEAGWGGGGGKNNSVNIELIIVTLIAVPEECNYFAEIYKK